MSTAGRKKNPATPPGYDREQVIRQTQDLVIKTMTPSGAAALARRARRATASRGAK